MLDHLLDLHKAADTNGRITELENTVERLLLVNRALWEFIRESRSLSDQDLLDKIREIDLRDGKLDGKLEVIKKCAKCDRALHPKHARCLYCGEPVAS